MKRLLLLSLLLCGLLPPAVQSQTLVPSGTPHQYWYLDHVNASADDSLLYRSGIGSWPVLKATFFRVTTNEGGQVTAVAVTPRVIELPVATVRQAMNLKPKTTDATLEQLLHDAVWRVCIDSLGVEPDSLNWSARLQ